MNRHTPSTPVLLARQGGEVFAVGASCTHYGGPLAEGLLVGETVRCPWHHAAFSLRTGEALRAPALGGVACWHVEQREGKVYVTGKRMEMHLRTLITSLPLMAERYPEHFVAE